MQLFRGTSKTRVEISYIKDDISTFIKHTLNVHVQNAYNSIKVEMTTQIM